VSVPRQTLARWIIRSAEQVLQPVFNLLRDTLLDHDLIHMDETTVQVLKEAGRAATSGSYMWVQTGGPPARPVILYDYDPSRSGEVPQRLLADWRGYLMTDGYRAYDAVVKAQNLTHLACMAHVRRGFVEAAAGLPKGKPGRAGEAIELIRKLYRVEREVTQASVAGEHLAQMHARRLAARQERSKPVLKDLRTWLDTARPKVTPSARLGQAIAYADKYWSRIERYTERGDLPIGRVEMWRGGSRSGLSVSAPFVWRCPSNLAVAPFPHPPRRTGRADCPHPALFRRIKPSHSSGRVQTAAGVSAPTSRRGTGRSIGGTPFPACRCAFAARSENAARCNRPGAGRYLRPALG
jgi:transposase